MNFPVTIIYPTHSQTMQAQWVEANSQQGNIIIQYGHAPALIVLKSKSSVTIAGPDGVVISVKVQKGILEVEREKVMLFVQEVHE